MKNSNVTLSPPASDPYEVRIGGEKADPYRIALAYGLDPIIFQAVKKLLRCGRKHKPKAQDVREAITTLERWEEIERGSGNADCGSKEGNPPVDFIDRYFAEASASSVPQSS